MARALRSRATAAAVALLGLSLVAQTSAHAATRGTTAGSTAATSAVWAAVPTLSTTAPYGTGPLTLTFARTGNGNAVPTPQYLNVVNTGTLALQQATYGVTVAGGTTTALLEACSAAWDETNHLCVGVTTTVATSATAPAASTTVPGAAGSTRRLRVSFATNPRAAVTVTVDVAVARAQAAAARRTSS